MLVQVVVCSLSCNYPWSIVQRGCMLVQVVVYSLSCDNSWSRVPILDNCKKL